MLIFILAISCLTTSNLPWCIYLTSQVPMQYCSLQHRTLLPTLVTSTTGHCFHFGSISSFFLELFLHSSPVAYWAPTNLGSSSFKFHIFLPFPTVYGVLKARIMKCFPFPSPVDHILSEFSPRPVYLGWPDVGYYEWNDTEHTRHTKDRQDTTLARGTTGQTNCRLLL